MKLILLGFVVGLTRRLAHELKKAVHRSKTQDNKKGKAEGK